MIARCRSTIVLPTVILTPFDTEGLDVNNGFRFPRCVIETLTEKNVFVKCLAFDGKDEPVASIGFTIVAVGRYG